MASKIKTYIEFPSRIEEDGSTSILVKDKMYIRNIKQKKEGDDIYGEYEGNPCVVTAINGGLAVIVCELVK